MTADLQEQSKTAHAEPRGEEVREQLNRLLANPFFSHSKRFPSFLRFVVEQTLAGESENIKERTLGSKYSAGMRSTTPRRIQSFV